MIRNLQDYLSFSNRHNLCVIKCNSDHLPEIIDELVGNSIKAVNIGQEVARELVGKELKNLAIIVHELLYKLTEKNVSELFPGKPKIIVFYNLGILFEPFIRLNVEQILKEFSKQYCIIVLWDSQIEDDRVLHWDKQKDTYQINLSDINPLIIDKTL